MNSKKIVIFILFCVCVVAAEEWNEEDTNEVEVSQDSWSFVPTRWSLEKRIPMMPEYDMTRKGGKFKVKKKIKKFLFPLLLAYKLKFFTLIPVLIGGLVLLTGATGLAGFFFALFAAVMGLKAGGGGGH